MKQRFVNAKIGTIPSPGVWIRTEPKVGETIRFREYGNNKWEWGIVDRINPDGFLFISR